EAIGDHELAAGEVLIEEQQRRDRGFGRLLVRGFVEWLAEEFVAQLHQPRARGGGAEIARLPPHPLIDVRALGDVLGDYYAAAELVGEIPEDGVGFVEH